jgi:hypothetical protein
MKAKKRKREDFSDEYVDEENSDDSAISMPDIFDKENPVST